MRGSLRPTGPAAQSVNSAYQFSRLPFTPCGADAPAREMCAAARLAAPDKCTERALGTDERVLGMEFTRTAPALEDPARSARSEGPRSRQEIERVSQRQADTPSDLLRSRKFLPEKCRCSCVTDESTDFCMKYKSQKQRTEPALSEVEGSVCSNELCASLSPTCTSTGAGCPTIRNQTGPCSLPSAS